tara:strand:- start:4674 stop:5681 length:1008 start_codon:yes stop_codon:yes gene_type:complete
MKFSLIICTFRRPEAIRKLLNSVKEQNLKPNEILIVDASEDDFTLNVANDTSVKVEYFKVDDKNKGLTKQRNFGIKHVSSSSEIICFLDDDIVLKPEYFQKIMETYQVKSDAMAVGGYILGNSVWVEYKTSEKLFNRYYFDGFSRKLSSRHLLRKKVGLLPKEKPGIMPEFSNGFSIGFLPPSGKIYQVDYFMGGVSSYKKGVFDRLSFSEYFHGYGLYEDMDFCLRLSKLGKLYVNTAAQLYHYHEEAGRPNKYEYGKMVVRNGWYVWKLKNAKPSLKNILKWHATLLLLTAVRIGNIFTTTKRKQAFTESIGRFSGYFSLWFNAPKIHDERRN